MDFYPNIIKPYIVRGVKRGVEFTKLLEDLRNVMEIDRDVIRSNDDDCESGDDISAGSISYGMENCTKNALLVFVQISTEHGIRNMERTMEDVEVLKNTFEKYLFEVDIQIDLTSAEIETKCREFFNQDFSNCGAVVVIVLSPEGDSGILSARDQRFHENVIVQYYTSRVPESLKGKPKIYITEAHRHGIPSKNGVHSLPIHHYHEDVLGLHIPVVVEGLDFTPIEIICRRMRGLEDMGDFLGIMIGTIQELEDSSPILKEKVIELASTMRKRVILPKVEAKTGDPKTSTELIVQDESVTFLPDRCI